MLVKKLKETFEQYDGQSITLQGWVRTNRNSKAVGFIALNDGTTFSNVQVVYADSLENFDEVSKITTGSAMEVTGKTKIKGKLFTLSVQNSKESVIVDEASLPKKYWVKKVTEAPDKKGLYDLLKEGKKVKGASLQENRSLRIR